jgi:hypothetical protein
MAKNTKYLTMALTHKKNYHIFQFNVGKKYLKNKNLHLGKKQYFRGGIWQKAD